MNAIEQYLKMADEALQESKLMLQHQFYRGAVSRAYYASFYAVQACLESISVNVKTHQGALLMFSKHFIKTNLLPKQFGKFLQDNLEQRLIGDYEIGFKAKLPDATISLENAETIVSGIKELLQNETTKH